MVVTTCQIFNVLVIYVRLDVNPYSSMIAGQAQRYIEFGLFPAVEAPELHSTSAPGTWDLTAQVMEQSESLWRSVLWVFLLE